MNTSASARVQAHNWRLKALGSRSQSAPMPCGGGAVIMGKPNTPGSSGGGKVAPETPKHGADFVAIAGKFREASMTAAQGAHLCLRLGSMSAPQGFPRA